MDILIVSAVLAGLMVLMGWVTWVDIKHRKERQLKRQQAWEEELKKPLYRIEFHTSEGVFYSSPINPYKTYGGHLSSRVRTEIVLQRELSEGYIRDENNIHYPACNLLKALVVQCP